MEIRLSCFFIFSGRFELRARERVPKTEGNCTHTIMAQGPALICLFRRAGGGASGDLSDRRPAFHEANDVRVLGLNHSRIGAAENTSLTLAGSLCGLAVLRGAVKYLQRTRMRCI